jgi:glutathione S-transferase
MTKELFQAADSHARRASADASRFKVYSENSSPFSASVRAAIYAKRLPIEIVSPPDGLRSAKYHSINPMGTIPCLVRDDGFVLPESAAILDYLDDIFPEPALRPFDPDLRARMRLLQRIGELGIMTSCVDLLEISRVSQPDEGLVSARLTRLVRSLASLEVFLAGLSEAVTGPLTLADCQLCPALACVPNVAGVYGKGDLIGAYPLVSAYFAARRTQRPIRLVLEEMASAGL